MFPPDVEADLRKRAKHSVWGGYESMHDASEGLLELVEYDPPTKELVAADRSRAAREIDTILKEAEAAHAADELTWPPQTDCDRLTTAFARLEDAGIVARENTGYDMSDVRYEMGELVRSIGGAGRFVRGWVTFHGQDLERAVDSGTLFLAFAPVGAQDEKSWRSIGDEISKALRAEGLDVHWDGRSSQRLEVRRIVWRRRRGSKNR